MSKYPEHEKLKAKERESYVLSGFIDFIGEQGWHLSEYSTDRGYGEHLRSIHKRPDEIIGLYLGIDPKKLDAEKNAMLAEVRKRNKK